MDAPVFGIKGEVANLVVARCGKFLVVVTVCWGVWMRVYLFVIKCEAEWRKW